MTNPNDPLPRTETAREPDEREAGEDHGGQWPLAPKPGEPDARDERWSPHAPSQVPPPRIVEPPPSPPIPEEPAPEEEEHHHRHPLDRVTGRLPRNVRVAVDWIVTIVGAIAIVLAIKAWVVNPYRIPSSSMEPTLHCARPAPGCEARFSDRVLANRFIYHFHAPQRGDIIVFNTPPEAQTKCGSGGTFVKRIIGLPGETVQERVSNGAGYIYIDGRKLDEPYVQQSRRDIGPAKTYHVPPNSYFVMGDNRAQSCDSRVWGAVPRKNIIGKVFMTYWPPNRISFR